MSHEEPRRTLLPSRLGDVAPSAGLDYRTERFAESARRPEPVAAGPRRSSAWEGFGRALRRHWWQILPLFALATGLVWFCLLRWLPNTYEAYADIQFEAGAARSDFDFAAYKQTQEHRVVSPDVVDAALVRNPDLASHLVTPDEPRAKLAILRGLTATLRPGAHLIRVSMTAPHDDNLAAIVDEVIAAYLARATDFIDEGAANRKVKLRQLMQAKSDQVKKDRQVIDALVGKLGAVNVQQGLDRHTAAIERHSALTRDLQKIELEVVAEEAHLDQSRRDEAEQTQRPKDLAPTENDVTRAFYRLPEVVALRAQQDQANESLVSIERDTTKDAAAKRDALKKRAEAYQDQINRLYQQHRPVLRVAAAAEANNRSASLESSRIEAHLNGLKAQRGKLSSDLDTAKGEMLAGGSEVLKLDFARQDLERDEAVLKSMTQSFQEAEVGAAQPVVRARKEGEGPAQTVERSAGRERWAIGLAVPALTLLGLLGFFSLVERRVGRILDPADLPTRARLNVIGLVPPLPKGRGRVGLDPPSGGKSGRSAADLERFIQSLDQLRVLVCGRGDASGRPRRSLLITSAGEGEGKSTLAAQLAERSVSAGLLTLLIDADLRNPSLSRMFDRPESVGLANVLRGELMAEEAIGTVTEAGGFHFLAAGQVRDDLSRLLASDRLARLLESARESFDLVLVDSPPVLPVADALTIGQWVDGAVLTVRHKSSRLPLVERAAQQLASVGVTVLGAVVNGVRDRYAPYYGPRPEAGADRSTPAGSAY